MNLRFWRLKNGMSRLGLVIRRMIQLAKGDLRDIAIDVSRFVSRPLGLHAIAKTVAYQSGVVSERDDTAAALAKYRQRIDQEIQSSKLSKPVIFISACMDEENQGGWKYNGGIKEFNCLAKLLRLHGYEAYIVTYDGQYEPWLIDHQPHISLQEFRARLSSNQNVRCVTSWMEAEAFIRECQEIYFWDMEVGFSENEHFSILANLHNQKVKNTAAISRTIQAWHMAQFAQPCTLLPNLVDDSLWYPIESQRKPLRVGYMEEGLHTNSYMTIIRETTLSEGLNLEFLRLEGDEAKILSDLRTCTVFLTMNIGKYPLWGEGGPLPPLEALSTGCIPIAFDILGPREFIHNNFNGLIVPCYRPDLMANALVSLYKKTEEIERMHNNALALFNASYTFDARWFAVKEFLELPELEEAPLEPRIQEYATAY
jgi:hypothetical protein